jgi:hypothetical protein
MSTFATAARNGAAAAQAVPQRNTARNPQAHWVERLFFGLFMGIP